MKGLGLALLLVLLPCMQAWHILIASHSGNYNISTSLPAWERLDATGTPSFIIAEDIVIPLQLTRCDELVFDVTLKIAEGSNPSEITNVTFWIFPNSVMQLGKPFNPALAMTNETFTQPSEGSWFKAAAVESWTQGPQVFYVVTPRFRITRGVALRGNSTYWIAMLIGQERRISPVDSTFNTPRWLEVGTPSYRLGSPALFRGVDRFGNMFRSFPALSNWSNASYVESVAMPFLANTATVSETHQMSFTAYVGSCYAPPNVIIPSSKNFTDLPSPTAYTLKPSPVSAPPPPPGPTPEGTSIPIPLVTTTVPQPSLVQSPTSSPSSVELSPSVSNQSPSNPIPGQVGPSPVSIQGVPSPSLIQNVPSPIPVQVQAIPIPESYPPSANGSTSLIHENPFASPVFIGIFFGVALVVIIGVLVALVIWARRFRTRITYDKMADTDDKTIELDDGNIRLNEDNSSSDSIEIQNPGRFFNPSVNVQTLMQEQHDGGLTSVSLTDPQAPSIKVTK